MDDGRTPDPEEVNRQGANRGTGLREQIRRELGVMFSMRTQPTPVRVAKWVVFLAVARGLHGTRWFRAWVFGFPSVGIMVHLFYRHMTRSWTRPWGGWADVEAVRPRIEV
jgi:hypothetical protein